MDAAKLNRLLMTRKTGVAWSQIIGLHLFKNMTSIDRCHIVRAGWRRLACEICHEVIYMNGI